MPQKYAKKLCQKNNAKKLRANFSRGNFLRAALNAIQATTKIKK